MVSSSQNFRQALKRTCSQPKVPRSGSVGSGVGTAARRVMSDQETTPILNGNGHAGRRRYSTFASIFSKHQTLGENSEHLFVKWPARGFTVTKVTLLSNYVNILLVFVPLGIIAGATGWSPTAVFILNFFAIIPLAAILSFATEEISMKLGETLGGLLNATFGNAVELIVSIVALRQGQIRIVQSSMLGSILSNILLVLGTCFVCGGIYNTRTGTASNIEQGFNATVASTMSSLMAVASASLIIPATLFAVLEASGIDDDYTKEAMLQLSHGTAIILLILYVMYLVFQLKTHADLFDPHANVRPNPNLDEEAAVDATEDDDSDEPQMSPIAASAVLVLTTVTVAICAEYLVDSIDSLVATTHITKTFIGLILLPIVGNAAEHVTAVVVAIKDKMDLAMGVAVGSSMQIALLVTPSLVILGWIIDQPMTLHFETFETVVFFLSVLVATYVLADGKSNYLEGAMLLGLYIIIALAFLVYPDEAGRGHTPKDIFLAARGLIGL